MAKGFSVFVNIGGKVDQSLAGAVNQAKRQVNSLSSAFSGIGRAVQAPFRSLNQHIEQTEKRLHRLQNAARNVTLGVSLPGAYAAKSAFDKVYGFEKELNKAEAYGELYGKSFEIGGKTQSGRKWMEDQAREMARIGYSGAEAAVELQRRYVQAGRSIEQVMGMTKPTLEFALFGDIEPAKAADVITQVVSAFRIPVDDVQKASEAVGHIGDVLAKGANISKADVTDFAEGFKYAAPFAAKAGMTIEQLTAAIAAMNNAGIRGNEAGVSLRSMLVRMVKPTADARAAIESYGLSFENFVKKWKTFSAVDMGRALATRGINIPAKIQQRISKAIQGMDPSTQSAEMRRKITDIIVRGLDLKPRDGERAAKGVSSYFMSLADEVDADGLIKALEDKNVTLGAIANLFDVRQGARIATLFNGGEYKKLLDMIQSPETKGASKRGADVVLQGIVGAMLRFKFAWDNLWISIARSGVLDQVTDALTRIGAAVNELGKSNPETLRFGTYLAAAAVAAGPLMWVLGGIARVGTAGLKLLVGAARLLVWPFRAAGIALLTLRGALLFTGVGAVLTAIATAGMFIYNNWNGLLAFFQQFGQTFMAALGPTASGAISTLIGLVSDLFGWLGKITGQIDTGTWVRWGADAGLAAASIVNTLVSLPSRIGNGIGEWVDRSLMQLNRMVDHFAELGSQINARMKMASADLYAAGAELINQLWEGIKAKFQQMLGWVTSKSMDLANAVWKGLGLGGRGGGGGGEATPPGRAIGGPVTMGKPYMVGERGPELFIPSGNGRIETNAALNSLTESGARAEASSTTMNSVASRAHVEINIDASGGDARDMARQAEAAVYRALARLESDQRGLLSD